MTFPLRMAMTLLCFCGAAEASLLSAWERALEHDAEFQVARADRDIALQELPLARAALLPQVVAQASLGRAETDISEPGPAGNVNRSRPFYDTRNWALQVRQPLFRSRALVGFRQGRLRVDSAEALFDDARQLLALRLIAAMQQWVSAGADVQYAEVDLAAAGIALEQAERQFQSGALTQVDRANAMHRQAQAAELIGQARLAQAVAIADWEQVTGDSLPPAVLLDAALAQRLFPGPHSVEDLMREAAGHNPGLRARLRESDVAREELRKARGERLPTLDLVLGRGYTESEAESTIGNRYLTSRVALQAAVPLFSGGAITAAVRQAQARLARAEALLIAAEAQLRGALAGEVAALELASRKAESARQAMAAAGLALRAAELGRSGGTSTQADHGRADSARAAAQRDLTQANAQAMLNWARIRQLLGSLGPEALRELAAVVSVEPHKMGD